MLNQESVDIVVNSKLNEHFAKPLYDGYAFVQIPQTVYHLLTGVGEAGLPANALHALPKRYQKVIVVLIDAFGWKFVQKYCDHPFIKRFYDDGVVSCLSTQFPSTTSAHVTSIHTGMQVGETGVYEWTYYEPKVDRLISPLMYSYAGEKARGSLATSGVSISQLLPNQTLYKRLKAAGVNSKVYGNRAYTPSPYSEIVTQGASLIPYETVSEGLTNLANAITTDTGSNYYYFYADEIDSMGHKYGPESQQFEEEVLTMLSVLKRILYDKIVGKASDALLVLTADHGQVKCSPDTTIYLNKELPNKELPAIERLIRRNRAGELLVPAGSPRDFFLHLRPEALEEGHELLSKYLEGRAEVFYVESLIQSGFFGTTVSPVFEERVGNLLVLPYDQQTVWWYDSGRFEMLYRGHHGGLVPAEMQTQALVLPLG